jgi:hypothetical protein
MGKRFRPRSAVRLLTKEIYGYGNSSHHRRRCSFARWWRLLRAGTLVLEQFRSMPRGATDHPRTAISACEYCTRRSTLRWSLSSTRSRASHRRNNRHRLARLSVAAFTLLCFAPIGAAIGMRVEDVRRSAAYGSLEEARQAEAMTGLRIAAPSPRAPSSRSHGMSEAMDRFGRPSA